MAGIKLLKKNPQNLNYIVNHLVRPNVKKYIFDDLYGYSEIAGFLYSGLTYVYGIFSKGEPEPKGVVILDSVIPYRNCSLYAVVFEKENRNQGMMKDIYEKIEKDIRSRAFIKTVSASVIGKNPVVEHILKTLKFEKIGTKKQYIVIGGKYKDVHIYHKVYD